MKTMCVALTLGALALCAAAGQAQVLAYDAPNGAASAPADKKDVAPDLLRQPTLFVVAYAHLDTQWRWCYPQSIREYLPATLHENFKFFDKYPNYVFNFSGSRRYQMMKEYYPEDYEKLKKLVKDGKWFPCGSSVDENDANVPSAESYVRHVLYGNKYFRKEFGVVSEEYMLPDCFGFPAALPSLLAHCGLKGFSTQKLTWNAVVPIPFKVGVWEGPDGHSVIAALDPGSYGGEVLENLATSDGWSKRIAANGKASGVLADYHYYGTGDQGGGPTDRSVAMVETSMSTAGGIKVLGGPADQLFKSISSEMREKLPKYAGELQLTEHSAGSITSEAYMKRWNRKNELLADAAERASVMAAWLGGRKYPAEKLEEAWYLVLGSQMHDILPGTSHPHAYDLAWNDEILAANEFSAILQDAAGVVASQLDTQGDGSPVVVFNPLSIDREDVVEAEVPGNVGASKGVTVTGPDGKAVAAQILGGTATSIRIAFLAKTPSVGFATYNVKFAAEEAKSDSTLKVDFKTLENARYIVKLNDSGDVSSIFDKAAKRELLSAPATLGQHFENPKNWPAWNQDWSDRQMPVKEVVGGAAKFKVIENGPARVAVEVVREQGASTFTQRIRLAGGDSDRIEFDCTIDWNARERSLRAAFPLAVSNSKATYDLQTGAIERGNGQPKQYEYAFQQWFDLTDSKGDYGVTVMSDSKYGADKPSDNTVRLTLLHTPGTHGGYQDQGTQDIGRHHIQYALAGHQGDWRQGATANSAARLNQPLLAFNAGSHKGTLGKSFSLLKVSDANVRVTAIKKAEEGNEIVLRLRELSGRPVKGAQITADKAFTAAREVDGQEREIAQATLKDGSLVTDIGGYELRAFAVKFGDAPVKLKATQSTPIDLAFDTDVVAPRSKRTDGSFDGKGNAYPAEQFPTTVMAENVAFKMGPKADGSNNALTAKGQEIKLPAGDFDRIYILAASSDGDVNAPVKVDGATTEVRFRSWNGVLGQWDRRLWLGEVPELTFNWNNELGGIEPGYVKPEQVAWYNSHYSTPTGDTFYGYCYLYKTEIKVPKGAKALTLPSNDKVKIFAISAVNTSGNTVTPAGSLADTLEDHAQDAPRIVPDSGKFTDAHEVRIEPRLYFKKGAIRYTRDGSEPTATSAVYSAPIMLSSTETITAAVFDDTGKPGPVVAAKIDVNDTTAPTVKEIVPTYKSPTLRVEFSEPVNDTGSKTDNYTIEPAIAVTSATLSSDRRTATLHLASAPDVDKTYKVSVKGVQDNAPAKNTLNAMSMDVRVHGPVYKIDAVTKEMMGTTLKDVAGLPTKGSDPWTMNMFVKMDKQPANRTIIAGFGKCEDSDDGVGRYLAKFTNGAHFWSRNRDCPSKTQLDLNTWQMITATYDGTVLRLYKDGKQINQRAIQLNNDSSTISFAPVDPWEKKRTFEGEIKNFAIWNTALTEEAITSLKDTTKMD